MHRISKWFNNMKIRTKLFLSLVLVVIVPVLIVGLFLTAQFREKVLDEAVAQSLNNVDRIKQRTSQLLAVPIDVANTLYDDQLRRIANTSFANSVDVFRAYRDYTGIKSAKNLHKEIRSIRFYMDNPTLLNNWEFMKPNTSTQAAYWYKEAQDSPMALWYYFDEETNPGDKYLNLVRRIDFLEYRTSGILVISLNRSELTSILMNEPYDTMIIDENNHIVASTCSADEGLALSDVNVGMTLDGFKDGTYDTRVDGKQSKVVVESITPDLSRNGLRIVSVIGIEGIVKDANRIGMLGLMIMLFSFIVAILLISFVSKLLSNRMLQLSREMNKVASGNLNVALQLDGNDEVGQLARQFNGMMHSIRDLMEEVRESNEQQNLLKIKQKEIKLRMMASQINPHFLFNALESIRMKAHMNKQTEIAQTVKLLGTLMRKNLEIGGSSIKLDDEIEIVRCYLEIQRFRFGDRLAFELDIDPRSLHVRVPPLIVQPLVENAVVHGLESKEEGGCVVIRTTMSKDRKTLIIEISDNGEGMTEERLEQLMESLDDMEDREGYRIGMRNVHQRLKLTYGELYALSLESTPDEGTQIRMTLPAGREEW
ncbi:two-component system sensor histidine kinase YesM [Paenibacillus cellulosilyticus]|uniref:histidine kinase n=1 Tax=Paenibacillus cellulosilyticus TaxID=375489 RepID=A0A2V2YAQ1_9BACL|nr:sensor histidine kinase [Paenibacillus cellulosilyticus]PWV88444.1 two-component system sensor histidine kinase YesM [Paenibacillus cellulosilyticus]QKS44289.1 sensor histidine kinase [Paenibacillus cellulosilyticus]